MPMNQDQQLRELLMKLLMSQYQQQGAARGYAPEDAESYAKDEFAIRHKLGGQPVTPQALTPELLQLYLRALSQVQQPQPGGGGLGALIGLAPGLQ